MSSSWPKRGPIECSSDDCPGCPCVDGSRAFFFSRRRRHTRCGRDWSSDVCSSDLPVIAEGQVEGGAAQSLGYGICEEMVYDQRGLPLTNDLSSYRIYNAPDMPSMETYMEIGRASCRERV